MQSQVTFNRVPEKAPVPAELWRRARSSSSTFEARSGSMGSGEGCRTQTKSGEVFPAFRFPARCRKMCKNNTLPLLGIPPRFFFPRAAFSAGAWSCDSVYTGLSPDVLTAVILWSVPSCVESFYTGLSSVVRNPTCVLGVVKRLGDGWVGGARSWPRGKGLAFDVCVWGGRIQALNRCRISCEGCMREHS